MIVILLRCCMTGFAGQKRLLFMNRIILKVDFTNSCWAAIPTKVVANLPYNMLNPVLFRFLEERQRFPAWW